MKASSDLLSVYIQDDLARYTSESPERCWQQFAASALQSSILQKYVGERGISDAANVAAADLFLKVNEELIDAPREPERLMDQHLLGELKLLLYRFWHHSATETPVSDLSDLFMRGRTGPGSCIGSREVDFYTKLFSSKLSTTKASLYRSYITSSSSFPTHRDAEKVRAQEYGPAEVVGYSKLLFVPKRNDISRTICVEPGLNMFYQLGLASILESRLRSRFKIDLSIQPDLNRELARLGSINGSFATIDLSSASDSLALGVLKEILPSSLMNWLLYLRTPETKLPDGRTVRLRMVSTMGNGFTFPLETLIFTAVVLSAFRVAGIRPIFNVGPVPGNFGVFGDDIVIPTVICGLTMRLLWLLGFTLNAKKTFVEGPFRESCGSDWFNGHFVRGVYIKSLLSQQDRYVAINLLNDWSATTEIPLRSSVRYLYSTVKKVFVPPLCGLDEGIHVPLALAKGWRFDSNGSFSFPSYRPRPTSVEVGDTAFKGQFSSIFNPPGLSVAFLAGHIRDHRITLRQRVGRYGMKRRILPLWDWMQPTRLNRRFSFTRWETSVGINLYK